MVGFGPPLAQSKPNTKGPSVRRCARKSSSGRALYLRCLKVDWLHEQRLAQQVILGAQAASSQLSHSRASLKGEGDLPPPVRVLCSTARQVRVFPCACPFFRSPLPLCSRQPCPPTPSCVALSCATRMASASRSSASKARAGSCAPAHWSHPPSCSRPRTACSSGLHTASSPSTVLSGNGP